MIELWHPTPIGYYDLTDNEKQLAFIESKTNERSILNLSQHNCWDDNVCSTAKNIKNIFFELSLIETYQIINNYVFKFLKEWQSKYNNNNRKISSFVVSESWYNFLQPNGFQGVHTHIDDNGSCFLEDRFFCSGVFFYDLEFIEEENKPSLIFCLTSNYNFCNQTKNVSFNYVPGRIVLFPSSVPHKVMFNQTNKIRKTISFNVKVFF